MAGPYISVASINQYAAGNAFPTSTGGTEFYPIDPILL